MWNDKHRKCTEGTASAITPCALVTQSANFYTRNQRHTRFPTGRLFRFISVFSHLPEFPLCKLSNAAKNDWKDVLIIQCFLLNQENRTTVHEEFNSIHKCFYSHQPLIEQSQSVCDVQVVDPHLPLHEVMATNLWDLCVWICVELHEANDANFSNFWPYSIKHLISH